MIILAVHQHRVFALKKERKTPVAADIHRPMTFQVTVQWMQPPAWSVHVLWPFRVVQGEQLLPQLLRMLGLDSGLGARLKESLHTLVPEGPDQGV